MGRERRHPVGEPCSTWVHPATQEDVEAVIRDGLRAQDVQELTAQGRDPRNALRESFVVSIPHVFSLWVLGKPVAIFGAAPRVHSGHLEGVPWMLASDGVFKHDVRLVMAYTSRWIDYLNQVYPVLVNWVDERNTISVKWLKHCDFTFDGSVENLNGVRFLRFFRCAPV